VVVAKHVRADAVVFWDIFTWLNQGIVWRVTYFFCQVIAQGQLVYLQKFKGPKGPSGKFSGKFGIWGPGNGFSIGKVWLLCLLKHTPRAREVSRPLYTSKMTCLGP